MHADLSTRGASEVLSATYQVEPGRASAAVRIAAEHGVNAEPVAGGYVMLVRSPVTRRFSIHDHTGRG